MKSLTLLGAVVLAAAAHAQTHQDTSLTRAPVMSRTAACGEATPDGRAPSCSRTPRFPSMRTASELGKASAIAGLTLLLGAIAVLKGWRRRT